MQNVNFVENKIKLWLIVDVYLHITFPKFMIFNIIIFYLAKLALSKLDSSNFSPIEITDIFDKLQMKQNQLTDIQSKLEDKLFSLKTLTFTKISEPNTLRNLINLIEFQKNYDGTILSSKIS